MNRRTAAAALVAAGFVLAAGPAQAGITTYPVPCKSCSYVASASCKMPTPGFDDHLYGFVRYDIDRKGRVHVRTVAWIGDDWAGPEALDRVLSLIHI